jgi:hypothetical protein
MRVYEVLRNGLLEDKLISGQPAFAKEHLKKVPSTSMNHSCSGGGGEWGESRSKPGRQKIEAQGEAGSMNVCSYCLAVRGRGTVRHLYSFQNCKWRRGSYPFPFFCQKLDD